MTKSNLVIKSVIKGYWEGKSYDDIAYENSISKGSVFNFINKWLESIEIPDISEIREFSVMLRKSGISIKQCAQSFRFIQILANFGITDELDSTDVEDNFGDTSEIEDKPILKREKIGKGKKRDSSTSKYNFYYFIESIYNDCRKHRIESTHVVQWLHDLLEFDPLSHSESNRNISSGFEEKLEEQKEIHKSKAPLKNPVTSHSQAIWREKENEIPFISKINEYIQKKKSEVQNLAVYSKKLHEEIKKSEEQKSMLDVRVSNLKKKESFSLTYLDWYKSLKVELFNQHNINLEEEINSFVNVFNDFKYYDYDAHEIVKEYKGLKSLRSAKESVEEAVRLNKETNNKLLNDNERLEQNQKFSKESLNIVLELYHAGFEFEQLRQLKNTVVEISEAYDISWYDAGKKFIQDIKSQYDSKLGFETKINDLEAEKKKLEGEVPGYKERLQSQVNALGALQYLYHYGVTDDDIINMSDVVMAYVNGNITFKPNQQTESIVDENKFIRKHYYWTSLINEIRNLGDINSQIANQSSNLEEIKKEVDNLNSQRQKLNEQTLLSSQLLNSLSSRLSSFMEFIKQIMFSVNNTNKMLIVYQPLFFVNVTIRDDSKYDNNIDANDKSL